MVSELEKEFMSFPCSTLFTASSSPSNTFILGDLKKGHIVSGRNKPLQWLVILVLLTSSEVGSSTGNTVGCAFDLITTSIKVDKWNSQRG